MLLHALLAFHRSVSRQRLYTALNVGGLAAGIAVFLLLATVVRYENGYNRWLPDAARTDRLDTTWTLPGQPRSEVAGSSFLALDLLRQDFPEIQAGARALERRVTIRAGDVLGSDYLSLVDPNFLDVIRLPLLEGDPAAALSTPSRIVLSQSSARKYFGAGRAVGRSLVLTEGGRSRTVTVSAVMRDLPADSTLRFSMLAPFPSDAEAAYPWLRSWGSDNANTFLRFRSAAAASATARGLRAFIARRVSATDDVGPHPADSYALSLVPLTALHFHDLAVVGAEPGVDRQVVRSLGALGVLALLIAAINYVNLATARAGLRAREVALRKVMGATPAALVAQFMGEALVLVSVSGLIGLALVELAIPLVDALGGWSLHLDYCWALPVLAATVGGVTVAAGCYPALLLARFRPAPVLAASRLPSGGRLSARLRTLLVLVQFVAAVAFAICTLVMDQQARFLRTADRGFEQQGLILVLSTSVAQLTARQPAILDRIRRIPGVVAATGSNGIPNGGSQESTTVARPGLAGEQPTLNYNSVSDDYFRTFGIPLLAGRAFDAAHGTDDAARVPSGDAARPAHLGTVISLRAVSSLGFPDPRSALGGHFRVDSDGTHADLAIIGVVDDVRFGSPREPVPPQFYLERTDGIDNAPIVVRFRGVSRAEMTRRLQATWQAMAPDEPFRVQTVADRLSAFYRPDAQRARLFTAGAVLAIAIACVGLYGLASFNTVRRVREIGIRKVLGASTTDVLLLLVGQFVRPVLLANLLAWPIAWAAMRAWLAGFDQRLALSPRDFLLATAVAIAISVLTVLGQAWTVARAEPARALRHE